MNYNTLVLMLCKHELCSATFTVRMERKRERERHTHTHTQSSMCTMPPFNSDPLKTAIPGSKTPACSLQLLRLLHERFPHCGNRARQRVRRQFMLSAVLSPASCMHLHKARVTGRSAFLFCSSTMMTATCTSCCSAWPNLLILQEDLGQTSGHSL